MIGLDAGELDRRVVVERATTETDDYGGEVKTWSQWCKPWAKITYGRAEERRQAAQEEASLVATFRVRDNAKTSDIRTTDRIVYENAVWDISSNVPFNRTGRDITAIRKS
ncbi:phage head closure protein [Sphingomonas sp. RB3P16]|uniref:phage head closure protein n=1 Tax=Parasphingomonas frigoris TaxID=3096163 RepID=UPI002FC7AB22